ncbi:MAG: hypothetical protein H7838_08060 [Magnetococcus sp. DMHC-8]
MIPHPDVINVLQTGFPLAERPFLIAAGPLGLTEESLMAAIGQLLQTGLLSRFGPLYNAERMGGGLTLAALTAPAGLFDQVAAQVNAFPEVAHNYARDHLLNMWFVVATERREEIAPLLAEITRQTGCPVFNLPKLAEYRLGFQVRLADGRVDTVPMAEADADPAGYPVGTPPELPDAVDRALVAATQAGLPLVPRPYHAVADQVGVTAQVVLDRLTRMLAWGWIRRLGVVPNHYALGLRGNGMSVWDLPDDQVDAWGMVVGGLGFVSHCYRRPRQGDAWPFNLFAMVHGPDRASVADRVALIQTRLGDAQRDHALLHSTRILKKSGLRLKHSGA